jgi:PAS domain S-box-containing protein
MRTFLFLGEGIRMKQKMTKAELQAELEAAQKRIAALERMAEWRPVRKQRHRPSSEVASGEEMSRLLDILPMGVSILDGDLNVVYENPALLRILDMTAEELRTGAYKNRKYIRSDGSPMPAEEFASAQAIKSGSPVHNVETGILKENGETTWMSVSAVPVDFLNWKMMIFTTDITGRKQAEANLHKSDAHYRLIAENSADVIWVLNPQLGKFTYVSPSVTKLRGYTPEEVMTQPMTDALTPESLRMVSESLAENLPAFIAKGSGTESFVSEVDQPHKDGSIVHTEVTTTYIFDERGEVEIVGVSRDITERKRAEDALRQSEQKYLALFEKAAVPAALTKMPEGVFADVNEAFRTTFGYRRDEIIGRNSVEIGMARPEERAESVANFEKYGALRDNEKHLFTRAGEARVAVININKAVIGGQDYVITTIHDVTERKRAEKELQESRAQLDTALESMTDAVFISDVTGTFTKFNEAFATFHKFRNKSECAKTLAEYPDFLEVYLDSGELAPLELWAVPRALRGETAANAEYSLRRKDTGERWVGSYSFAPIRDEKGAIFGSVVVGRDITERKKIENILKESERNYRELVQNANSAIVRWKNDGTITFFNEYAQSFFGYRPDEIIGKHVNILVPETESTGDNLSRLVENIVEHPEEFVNVVNENICQDGHRVWMAWTNKPIYDETGRVVEILAVGVDITERKKMENELRRSNSELEQFAYVASHDLQEPLRAMSGMVQLLEQRYRGQLDARADEYIEHAVEAANRMQTLINDLLTYSRVERRGRPFGPVDAAACVQVALRDLEVTIQESGARVTLDRLPTVMADASQLTQLFQNLIGNAIKFRGKREPLIHISATALETAWQFSVRDNGIGIEPQYFERIFLIFQRLHTRREYPGTGIGLSLCKKIVERHGGRIWVESEFGEGSTFHFTIPIRSNP